MHKQRFIFANSFVAEFLDSNIAKASIVIGRLHRQYSIANDSCFIAQYKRGSLFYLILGGLILT